MKLASQWFTQPSPGDRAGEEPPVVPQLLLSSPPAELLFLGTSWVLHNVPAFWPNLCWILSRQKLLPVHSWTGLEHSCAGVRGVTEIINSWQSRWRKKLPSHMPSCCRRCSHGDTDGHSLPGQAPLWVSLGRVSGLPSIQI